MFGKNINKILIITVFGAGFLTSFFIFGSARAALVLPVTDCDEQLINLRNAHGNSGHMLPTMFVEDGTKAFSYGNNFVSREGENIVINVNLRFVPDDPNATIKLLSFNSECKVVLGFSPVFHNLNFGVNSITYDTEKRTATLNGVMPTTFASDNIRYIWLEVVDKFKNSAFHSYSYLIDIQDLQNPTGDVDEQLPAPESKRPVLIIPGIMGSELYEKDNLVWPNTSLILDRVNDYFLVESLSMDENGKSTKDISVGNIVKGIDVPPFPSDYFNAFISTLETNGYRFGSDYYFFPFDWRLDLNENTRLLSEKIQTIKNQTHHGGIDVIAHSMGGFIVKDYIQENGGENINKLIFVGTPHLGAPKAAYGLMQGDIGVPMRFLNYAAIREISKNSPSVYQLLPNKTYHFLAEGYYRKSNGDILNYEKSLDLLRDNSMNRSLIENADNFFDKKLDGLDYSGIDVFNISGCRTATHGMYHISNRNIINGISYLNGDGTVPLVSSKYIENATEYYVRNAKHSELPSTSGVRELIVSILQDQNYSASNISNNTSFCNLKGKKLTWRSPVEVHVYDMDGNHTGPIGDEFENNISGVGYDIYDGEKYIFLPDDQEYKVEAIGEKNGTFDLLITDYDDNEGNSILFNDIEIEKGSVTSFYVSENSDNSQINFKFSVSSETVLLNGEFYEKEQDAMVDAVKERVQQSVGGPPPLGHHQESTESNENGRILGEATNVIPDGTLVLDASDGRTVYMIENGGKRYGFISEQVFLGRGYTFKDLILEDLSSYEVGGLINDTTTNIKLIKNI